MLNEVRSDNSSYHLVKKFPRRIDSRSDEPPIKKIMFAITLSGTM
jgi:hypothetical protein